ncbi:MAG: gliding motility-associated ABC transporter ATP-binding subunit GldA [Flavicella sp.]
MTVKVANVSKFYNDQKALNSISFEINKGEIVGFLGPNGAGKSTLMKILTGYLLPSEGIVTVNGVSVTENPIKVQRTIGYLPEHNPLYTSMYVREYLSFIADVHNLSKAKVQDTIEIVGLQPEAHKTIQQLSKGYQQRVGLAAALIHDPDVLILDEPTTGLDPNQLLEIRALIRDIGKEKIILFSTHILQEVEAVCNRVLIIKKGVIVADEHLSTLKAQQKQVIAVSFDYRVEERFFESIPHLIGLSNEGGTQWELTFDTQLDMRTEVFDFANQNGLKIVQLNTKNKNLESLFHELTT